MSSRVFKHTHTATTILTIIRLIALGMFSVTPSPVLAFAGTTMPTATALVAPVRTIGQLDLIAPAVPDYNYFEAGLAMSTATPITDRAVWVTKPAVVAYVIERPTLGNPLVLEGEASYYSRAGCLGCNAGRIMANGQPLDDAALTMAIGADRKHLVGYHARVTSLATGKSVTVKITDTGGFYQGKYGHRVADLTIATKEAIGIVGGVGQVRVEIL